MTLRPPFFRSAAWGGSAKCLLSLCLLLVLAANLFACAAVLNPGQAPARLQLAPAMPDKILSKPLNKQLVVALPTAERDIDTDNIALVFNKREVRYLAGLRWTSPAPNILQRALIDALAATNSLRGVTDESAGIAADAVLFCDLRQFSLHYADPEESPAAVIIVYFRLIDPSDGTLMAMRKVEVSVPAGGRDNADLISACETALSRCLAEISPWIALTMAAKS
ncbi:MAG: ABC-type transport auxiliary lipoprotein family protein [Desulfovibrio sp.]|nr:ABC-type transport auxiliary lipoprotein family protein [Desulfovibrio sp.]